MNKIIKEDVEGIIQSLPDLQKLSGKVVLISGANGFLPAYMVETLLYLNNIYPNFGLRVIALVRNKAKAEKRFNHLLDNVYFSIKVQDVCEEINIEGEINYIVHAASQASPKYYGIDPVGTLNANILGTINLIKLAHLKKAESFLYFSSGEVYGDVSQDQYPIKEDTFGYINPVNVRSCYAESKRMGENICVSWFHQFGVKAKIVRPFHTYGPGMALDDGRVFADFVANIINKEDIILNSDGSARRAFCYLADATKAFFMVLINGKDGEAYNVGNPGQEYSILELANILVGIKPGLKLKVLVNNKPLIDKGYLKSPLVRNTPDTSKVAQIGWQPTVSVIDGFTRTIHSYDA